MKDHALFEFEVEIWGTQKEYFTRSTVRLRFCPRVGEYVEVPILSDGVRFLGTYPVTRVVHGEEEITLILEDPSKR